MRASVDGKAMEVEVIIRPTFRLKLKGAMVTGYTTSSGETPVESWSLNFESLEQATE